jgi:hypothetical protein
VAPRLPLCDKRSAIWQTFPAFIHAFTVRDKIVRLIYIPDHRIVIATGLRAYGFIPAEHTLR